MPGISALLDSDMEDSINYLDENSIISSASDVPETASSKQSATTVKKRATKRHRVTMSKPKSRVTKSPSAPVPRKASQKSTNAKRQAAEEQLEENANANPEKALHSDVETQETAAKAKSRGRNPARGRLAKASSTDDAEPEGLGPKVEETSATARSNHAQSRPTKPAPRNVKVPRSTQKKMPSVDHAVETQESAPMELDSEGDELEIAISQPPVKPRFTSKTRQDPDLRRRAGSASDTERGDPNLRRRLGDITRKFENVDVKYRNLKEVGINEANANFEKLRKQCEATTEASNSLIASLKKELALQAPLANEARRLKKDVQGQSVELERLIEANASLTASLSTAQNEIKALQAKLTVARKAASVEPGPMKTPGSAIKSNAPTRTGVANNSEALHMAQMKLDLYSDLTGLIVRGVKRAEDGDTYDCIQTGRNGTLHFKLFIDLEDAKTASFEETEFLYTPLLDTNRDRDMIELMPAYLTEDITFARQNAAKFYQRVVDTLTRRAVDL